MVSTPHAATNAGTDTTDDGVTGEAHPVLVNGEVFEDWPQDLYIPPDALEVFLETFQGPLDLLLYLIRKQNLDILDIPVAIITRQYLEYIELMRTFRLDLAAEYLVMAAILMEIKSRMLLPQPLTVDEEEEIDPRALLIKRLQAYEQFSRAARDIDNLPRVERDVYLLALDFADPEPVKIESTAGLNDLLVAFRGVMERAQHHKKLAVASAGLSTREKMVHVLERVHLHQCIDFIDLFDLDEGKMGLVVSFVAILELVKNNMLTVEQASPFAAIQLKSIPPRANPNCMSRATAR